MGKSIYQQLIDGEVEVDHNGETLTKVILPGWLTEIGIILNKDKDKADEESDIMDILVEHDVFSGFLALGLQQAIVGMRARCRPADTPHPELKGELVKVSILADEKESRIRAAEYKPKALQRPKKEQTKEEQLAHLMATMDSEAIKGILAQFKQA